MKSTRKFARWVAPAVTAAIAVLGTSLVYSSMRDTLQIADHGSVNLPLPRDFTMRVIYADSAAVRDNISDLVGRMVAFDRGGLAQKISQQLLVAGTSLTIEPVSDGPLYESKVDRNASVSAKGTYLATLSGAFGANSMLEVSVSDIAAVRLSDAQIDWVGVYRSVRAIPESLENHPCFVQGVRLATVTYRAYTKREQKNSIAYGDVFAFDGAIYSTTEEHTADYVVSLDCLSAATMKEITSRTGLSDPPQALLESRAAGALRSLVNERRIVRGQVSGAELGTLVRGSER
jgi:hypothetical protein